MAPAITFLSPAQSVPAGSPAQVLTARDLTADGRAEALLATGGALGEVADQQLQVFSVSGAGSLTRTLALEGGASPEAMISADLNADGRADVALALAGQDQLAIYTTTTALTGPVYLQLPGGPNALTAGDFTGDIHADLAVVSPLSETISIWEGRAGGPRKLPIELPYQTGGFDALAAGDLDADGDDDLAALRGAGYVDSAVVIYLQESGSFPISYTLTPKTDGYLPHSLAVGDVNGDAKDDLVVTAGGNAPNAWLNVFPQEAGGLASTPISYPAFHLPSAVAIGDLTHDGRSDVVVLHDAWQTLSLYTQQADGTLTTYAVAAVPYSDRYRPDALELADLDGTGSLDVALVDAEHGLTVLTSTLLAPVATITQPLPDVTLAPGAVLVSGTANQRATTVQVRVRGLTDWKTVSITAGGWQSSFVLPAAKRGWWLEARAVDAQGRIQAPIAQQRIGVDEEPPSGQLLIEGGAMATNSNPVSITISAADTSGIDSMRLSEDPLTFGEWLPYSPSSSWTLSVGEGVKTLYLQLQDAHGMSSAPISDTIILDTLPPTSTLTRATLCNGALNLAWTGQDAGSGVATYDLQVRAAGSALWTDLVQQTTANTLTAQLPGDLNTRYFVRIRAADLADNKEDWTLASKSTHMRNECMHSTFLPILRKDPPRPQR